MQDKIFFLVEIEELEKIFLRSDKKETEIPKVKDSV